MISNMSNPLSGVVGETVSARSSSPETPTATAETPTAFGEDEVRRYDQVPKGCWVAVLAGLTGIPHEELTPLVPTEDFGGSDEAAVERWRAYHDGVCDVLDAHGWTYVKCGPNAPRGFAMGIGRSSRGVDHSVITLDGKLWHDPHPSREGVAELRSFELPVRIVRSTTHRERVP